MGDLTQASRLPLGPPFVLADLTLCNQQYDALSEIGHACGHNLIAEARVAAGLGLKGAMEISHGAITETDCSAHTG